MSTLPSPAFDDSKHHLRLYQGDCLTILAAIPESSVDLVFADPPYFLSNGGITCHAGRMVSVNKGEWDKSRGADGNHAFNLQWLAACQRVLKPNGSIWVSGTAHVIHSVGFAMQQLGFKLLNDISWVKPNPPPNLSCRYFTHATETIIWTAKNSKSRHTFNYKLMKDIHRGKQMKSVWTISPPPNLGRKIRQASHAKARGPTRTHPPCLVSRRRPRPRPVLRLRHHGPRRAAPPPASLGCELSLDYISLSIRRLCSEMVQIELSVSHIEFSLDLHSDPVDRSFADERSSDCFRLHRPPASKEKARRAGGRKCDHSRDFLGGSPSSRDHLTNLCAQLQLVQQERRFYFIGRADRRVIFSVLADSLDEARQKFRASGRSDSDALFIIKTETTIYVV